MSDHYPILFEIDTTTAKGPSGSSSSSSKDVASMVAATSCYDISYVYTESCKFTTKRKRGRPICHCVKVMVY